MPMSIGAEYPPVGVMVFPDMNSIYDLNGAGTEIALFGYYIEYSSSGYSGNEYTAPTVDFRVSFTESYVFDITPIVDLFII